MVMPVDRLGILALACAAALGTACASQWEGSSDLGSPVVQEGVVYTPVSVGPRGCVLYNIRIPGGQAPAALVYRDVEGQFAYGRPERCVSVHMTGPGWQTMASIGHRDA